MDTPPRDNIYQADSRLLIQIIDLVFRLKRDCYFCDIALLLFSGYMYHKYQGDLPFFAYCEAIMIGVLGFVQYILLSSKSRFINRTAIDVRFTANYLYIKTAGFDGPLWYKKPSVDFNLPLDKIVTKTVANPYPHIFKENKQLLRLRYQDNDVYLMTDYFDKRVQQELSSLTS